MFKYLKPASQHALDYNVFVVTKYLARSLLRLDLNSQQSQTFGYCIKDVHVSLLSVKLVGFGWLITFAGATLQF